MNNQQVKAKAFSERWRGKGYEKGECQKFWLELLQEVLGVANPFEFIEFENQVKLSNTGFIDAYIPSTGVLIEQKSIEKDLRAPIKQSDGTLLNPFQQAKKYITELPLSMHPRWVVTCNFRSFLIYDMERPQGEPFEILLENLEKEYTLLSFLTDTGDVDLHHELEVSIKAGEIIGKIYDGFLAQYGGNESADDLHALNVLCVRLVFCLYAEDAGIFGKDQFFNYLKDFKAHQMRGALKELFHTLDTPEDKRDKFLEPELKAFPYVNGSLFREEQGFDIPPISEQTAEILLKHASEEFDWSEISPTIFGAVFESTLNPDTRRSGGMHYTSIENIHKVIDPLFLNDLNTEFDEACQMPLGKKRTATLDEFQTKLSTLTFLDPAAGSGNFLTETYISLRRLENKVILEKTKGQMLMGFDMMNPVKVNIHQFYGIEINDFAVTVATTALWIAEAQMLRETEKIINLNLDYLPLKSNSNIVKGNALRLDWNDVINGRHSSLSSRHFERSEKSPNVSEKSPTYIMGNPPFVGARLMSEEQKQDVIEIFGAKWKNVGNLDYVCCWYKKATDLMQGTNIRAALVSTNSVSQGEQVANLWKPLMLDMGVHIDFAYRTFRWDSEASIKAHVHCVIIGFSVAPNNKDRIIYQDSSIATIARNINGYLVDGDNVFVENRSTCICINAPEARSGNKPIDGGFYLFTKEEKAQFIKDEPASEKYFRRWYGAEEFINNKVRYCLWLGDCSLSELRSMPKCLERVEMVRQFRLASKSDGTVKLADRPTRFHVESMPMSTFLVMPLTSSERRRYVPIGFLTPDCLASNLVTMIPCCELFHFGIVTSNVFMAWMRAVCGRLKSDYRITKDNVYNNFPWLEVTSGQKEKIEQTAQAILDARALYPECSLADLYDETTMPPELRKAHQANDRAVMEAYGFNLRMTESECVAELMKLYQQLATN